MHYYNVHVQEWIDRDYNNTMPIYNNDVICRFKSMLVERELQRQENLWYSLKRDFLYEFVFDGNHQIYPTKLQDITDVLYQVILYLNAFSTKDNKWWQRIPNVYLLLYGTTRGYIWL